MHIDRKLTFSKGAESSVNKVPSLEQWCWSNWTSASKK